MKKTITIGSRESKLAVIQSEIVKKAIEQENPGVSVSILTMKTTGDKILDRTLDKVGGKGLFVKELDRALLEGRTDLSVHSLKDVPMEVPGELPLLAFSTRLDVRDVLVLPAGVREPDFSKPVGCSSSRRILQFGELYPQAKCRPVRGNVLTRLRRLDDGEYGALILAAAGLERLGLAERISRYFSPEEMIPAAGQGILAMQGRQGEDYSYLESVADEQARDAALCERAFVRTLNGGCSSPTAAYARIEGRQIFLTGLYCEESTWRWCRGTACGVRADAERIGQRLAMCLAEHVRASGVPEGSRLADICLEGKEQ